MYDFNFKRFERPTHGRYTMIFPFSDESERLAIELNKQCSMTGGSASVGGPNQMKQLVHEIKQYYEEKAQFLKNAKTKPGRY